MTERERLIELLNKSCEERGWIMNGAKTIADYLLENGVIVSPCRVGDTVYQTDGNRIYKNTVIAIRICSNGYYFVTDNIEFDNTAISETVFLTREEAEKVLEDMK